jgi:hypothetical protein
VINEVISEGKRVIRIVFAYDAADSSLHASAPDADRLQRMSLAELSHHSGVNSGY